MLKRTVPMIILLLLSCEVDKNNNPKPVESVSGLSSPIPISTPIATSSVTPIASPSNLQPSPSPSWDCTIRSIDDYDKYIDEPKLDEVDKVSLQGSIYDDKNQPINNAVILVEDDKSLDAYKSLRVNCSNYQLKFEGKTDNNGFYRIEKLLSGSYFITVLKKGMTSRTYQVSIYGVGYPGPCFNTNNKTTFFALKPDKNVYCGYSKEDVLLRTEPQISEVIINNVKIDYRSFYSLPEPSIFTNNEIENLEDSPPDVVKKDAKRSVIKIIASEVVDIELIFSESIKKETIENNLQIISLENSSKILDKNASSVFLKWSEDNSKLNIKIKKLQDGKYRLAFKQAFEDIEGNKALSKKYFSFNTYVRNRLVSSQDLYTENIVFEYKN